MLSWAHKSGALLSDRFLRDQLILRRISDATRPEEEEETAAEDFCRSTAAVAAIGGIAGHSERQKMRSEPEKLQYRWVQPSEEGRWRNFF